MRKDPIGHEELRAFAAAVLARCGLSRDQAELCADALVQADLWGHQSHGVLRLSWYGKRLLSGACDPLAVPEMIVDSAAIAVIDAHESMGQISMTLAAREAIRRAKAHGLAAVAVRNSNHFGTAMYFTDLIAKNGCVAFASTNASPAMAPWGGRERSVGTNPWSWAAPAGRFAPMILDIANTAVARGKIYLARKHGSTIPAGWAIDASGAPTTDPLAAIEGIIQPMAGHKGYAIAVMMDMLSGVLSGSAFGKAINGPYQAEHRSGAGHFVIALDIAAFHDTARFGERMEDLIAELKSAPLAPGVEEIFYPGEIEARNDSENRRTGLLLPDDVIGEIRQFASTVGAPDIGA